MPDVPKLAHILDEDPELGTALIGPRRSVARRRALARVAELEPGPFDFLGSYGAASGWFGLLVLDGLILQQATVLGRSTTQMLGPGDLFCPWEIEQEWALLASSVEFELLTPARVALLDADFAERVRPWPEIASALIGRVDRRAHARVVARGLASYPRVEIRLVAFLWELAERCGVAVADERVAVPVPLTHRVLAKVVGCERSSVMAALGVLRRYGLVFRTRSGWMLRGSLPLHVEFLLSRAPRHPLAVVPAAAEDRRPARGSAHGPVTVSS